MHTENKKVLLISMPFAGVDIPSIQLAILESYLKERNIKIKTLHLYLKAAEIYGLSNYAHLVYPPNDSYNAQMIYSKYLFPEHYQKNKEKFKEYFNKTHEKLSFEQYKEKTDVFYNWFFGNINLQDFDIIGFSLNYGQLLPSLSFAKKIKEANPEKIIILGGSRTTGILGERVLQTFDFIDYIVSGDGEEPLYNISTQSENLREIPGLIYRENGKIISNGLNNTTDINTLPAPTFDSYYVELKNSTADIKQFFFYNGKLPIEISRGCWWNKCTFCSLNIQHKKYREKNAEKIAEEIDFLSNKYKILNFQMIGNTLPAKDHSILCEKIIELEKDFTFFAEARADNLKSYDYKLLKKAGFTHIQTGIESFSSNYLKKMNKGARVIDNIAALKFCKQNKIKNSYNLIIGYPDEENLDFEETKNNVKIFLQELDPPQICYLRVMQGSNIHSNLKKYNIEKLENTTIDKIMYPQEILEKDFSFVYDYKTTNKINTEKWEKLVEFWRQERENRQIQNIKNKQNSDEPTLYFVDGKSFLKIYDKRNPNSICVYDLDALERQIFLECIDIASFTHLKKTFKETPEKTIIDILKTFEEAGLIFKESDYYLSLPLQYSDRKIVKNEVSETKDIVACEAF